MITEKEIENIISEESYYDFVICERVIKEEDFKKAAKNLFKLFRSEVLKEKISLLETLANALHPITEMDNKIIELEKELKELE